MHKALGRTTAAMTLVLALSGCAQVDLDNISGATPSPTRTAAAVPTDVVMPSVLPSAQPSRAATVTVSFPSLTGYTVDPAATPLPTSTARAGAHVTSRGWSSRATECSVRAEVTSTPELLVAGGDDRHLSEAWSDSLGEGYRVYQANSHLQLTGLNGEEPYAGIATAFTAKVSGALVSGKTFARVWSDDGVAVSLTEVCQQGDFDETAWQTLLRGLAVDGLTGTSTWPGGEPTAPPTLPTATATATDDLFG